MIVANVDQLLIVTSAAEPMLKPNLIDRMLVTAEKARIRPVICINKIDLVDPADLQPLVGVYGQMGYQVLLLSATTGFGVERLRRALTEQGKRAGRTERRGQVVAAQRHRTESAAARANGQRRIAERAAHHHHGPADSACKRAATSSTHPAFASSSCGM